MTRAKLVELYINQHLTTAQVGAAIGVSQPTAVRYLKAWGIPARSSGTEPAIRCPKCGGWPYKRKNCQRRNTSGALCYKDFRERENARHREKRRAASRIPMGD